MKLLTSLLLSLIAVASAPALAANGIAFRDVHEATTGTTMPVTVIYPATGSAGATDLGPYRVAATPGLPVAEGRHPLVLISHGHGGSALGHHDLATALADAGFIVAAIEHAGDSHRDQSGFGTERVLRGRAWQVSALLDLLLADPQFGPRIDAGRVGSPPAATPACCCSARRRISRDVTPTAPRNRPTPRSRGSTRRDRTPAGVARHR